MASLYDLDLVRDSLETLISKLGTTRVRGDHTLTVSGEPPVFSSLNDIWVDTDLGMIKVAESVDIEEESGNIVSATETTINLGLGASPTDIYSGRHIFIPSVETLREILSYNTANKTITVGNMYPIPEVGDVYYIEAVVGWKDLAGVANTTLGSMAADINMNSHQVTGLSAHDAAGEAIRQTTKITEAALETVIDKTSSVLEVQVFS